jgi:hypothetical protein
VIGLQTIDFFPQSATIPFPQAAISGKACTKGYVGAFLCDIGVQGCVHQHSLWYRCRFAFLQGRLPLFPADTSGVPCATSASYIKTRLCMICHCSGVHSDDATVSP